MEIVEIRRGRRRASVELTSPADESLTHEVSRRTLFVSQHDCGIDVADAKDGWSG